MVSLTMLYQWRCSGCWKRGAVAQVTGDWRLGNGDWKLAVGCFDEAGDLKLEAGVEEEEVAFLRSGAVAQWRCCAVALFRRLEAWRCCASYWRLETGDWKLAVGCFDEAGDLRLETGSWRGPGVALWLL